MNETMRYLCSVLLLCFIHIECAHQKAAFNSLDGVRSYSTSSEQETAVRGLLGRLLPNYQDKFIITVNPALTRDAVDTVKVSASGGVVDVVASSGVSAAWGVNQYLKYYCHAHLSWDSAQLNLPAVLPDAAFNNTANGRFRYYQNVCTVSYSFVWWNWLQWLKHIDWLALNGFNLPLAFTAQEAVWREVYLDMGLTEKEVDDYFSGPAFLAWLRMGNMQTFAGPLSPSWHKDRMLLQKLTLKQMRSFGMIPVLPGFAGHVPPALTRIYPSANLTRLGGWSHFNCTYSCTYFLSPLDPVFQEVGTRFIKQLVLDFGTNHIYNCDTFNEMTPPTNEPAYLTAVGEAVYNTMKTVDPQAVWLMQGWLFLNSGFWQLPQAKALITSVPQGRMLILDLASETNPQYNRLESYFGQPWIWCMIHNFGGTLGLYGAVNVVNEGVFTGLNFPDSSMVGTGLTPEGINQNYVMYDFMNEMAWRDKPADLTTWFSDYGIRRYGFNNADVNTAWNLLKDSVYNCIWTGNYRFHGKYHHVKRPSKHIEFKYWYKVSDVAEAWRLLIKAASTVQQSPGFLHDLVDVTRNMLQDLFSDNYNNLIQAHNDKDIDTVKKVGASMLEMLDDMELILATSKDFLLGNWIADARSWGNTSQDKLFYEYNARNQITLWGDAGQILDYATKQWSGVVSSYYRPRWSLFIDFLTSNTTFNQEQFNKQVFTTVEEPFTRDTTVFPTEPKGDTVALATKIYQKWTKQFPRYYLIKMDYLNHLNNNKSQHSEQEYFTGYSHQLT